jgi:hypothetical protein
MMPETIWITAELPHAIHKRQITEHGGIEGVPDKGLLLLARSIYLPIPKTAQT